MNILVGIDGSERGERALSWALECAKREGASLTLVVVVDRDHALKFGVTPEMMHETANEYVQGLCAKLTEENPGLAVEAAVREGKVVDGLVEASSGHDLIVLGSHHGRTVRETIGGAKGLRVSVSASVPTVVVPVDWDESAQASGIVVGVGPDTVNSSTIAFGVQRALGLDEPLELVSAWGLPPMLEKPARAMGGGLAPVGEQFQKDLDIIVAQLVQENPGLQVVGRAVEGPSPSKTLTAQATGKRMLVLGTRSRNALGRALFGSVTHSVLLDLAVPTVVVPCE